MKIFADTRSSGDTMATPSICSNTSSLNKKWDSDVAKLKSFFLTSHTNMLALLSISNLTAVSGLCYFKICYINLNKRKRNISFRGEWGPLFFDYFNTQHCNISFRGEWGTLFLII